jgi:hypothetical protein
MEVYFVFTDTKTSLGRLIKRFTNHPYSHVSLSFSRDLSEVYSFGRKNIDNPFGGGFVKEDMSNQFFQRAQCAVFSCTVTKIEYELMKEFVKRIEDTQEQYKYNFLGLFGVLFEKTIERESAYFCSQFVATVFRSGGRSIVNKPPSLISPKDIYSSSDLNFIYEGTLMYYPFLIEQNQNLANQQDGHSLNNRVLEATQIA